MANDNVDGYGVPLGESGTHRAAELERRQAEEQRQRQRQQAESDQFHRRLQQERDEAHNKKIARQQAEQERIRNRQRTQKRVPKTQSEYSWGWFWLAGIICFIAMLQVKSAPVGLQAVVAALAGVVCGFYWKIILIIFAVCVALIIAVMIS